MAAMSPDKTRTLHNFALPTWGSQKLLRCTNPNPSVSDHPPAKKNRKKLFSGDNQIESIREKLIFDLRFEVAKMRAAILGDAHLASPQPPPASEGDDHDHRPGNRRTRRPARGVDGENVKFSAALSKEEIDDDFVKMIGKRPPRKGKKRPRFVQKEMDTLFPGSWLPEKITPDMYTVDDHTGK